MGDLQVMVSNKVESSPAQNFGTLKGVGDDLLIQQDVDVPAGTKNMVTKNSVAGAAEAFGFKNSSGLRAGHVRCAKDVLESVFKCCRKRTRGECCERRRLNYVSSNHAIRYHGGM